ncbi:hypothetical protein EB796_009912 [Bugula neritina]|nr:hypothetical protein EB796_009912 [Bugula neritina]
MLQKVQKLLNLESSVEGAEKMDHEDVQDRKRRRLGEDNDFRDESTTPLLKDKISKKLEKDETSMSISGDSLVSASVMETTTSCSPNEKQMST